MEKPDPAGLPLTQERSGTEDAAPALQPRDVSEAPPRTEEGGRERDPLEAEDQNWKVQWLEFLERSQDRLEEAAIWDEAKVLLSSLKKDSLLNPRDEYVMTLREGHILRVLPLVFRSWLRERDLLISPEVQALAEAYTWGWLESWRWETQVTAGSSSSAGWKTPPELGQDEDREQSTLAGLMPDCEKEKDPPGISLEGDEEETPSSWGSSIGQEENPTKDMMDQLFHDLGGTVQEPEMHPGETGAEGPATPSSIQTNEEMMPPFQEQEMPPGERGAEGPATHSSIHTLEQQGAVEKNIGQISTSGSGTLGSEEKPFLCLVCGRRFRQQHHLTSHQRLHTGEKQFPCVVCGKRFRRHDNFTSHQIIHTGDKPFPCLVCGKKFSRHSHLTSHQRIHTGDKPYKCSDCGKGFAQNTHLTKHRRTHREEKPYKCSQCGKSFAGAENLGVHLRVHTGERPYKCPVCKKGFIQSSHLAVHQRTHTGEKPHQCPDCSKSFATGSNLKRHLKVHAGEKPYPCPECGMSFSQKGNLTKHQNSHRRTTLRHR